MDIWDIILIPDLAACVTVLWRLRSIYWNECRTIGINAQITRHNMTSYIGTIYVGSCWGAGTQPPGVAAHAHQDGTGHICIFLARMSLTNLEGVLAHEYAHILTPWYEVRSHGTVWRANLTKLGYAEDADRYRHVECPASQWSYVGNRNTSFRALALIVSEEINMVAPGYFQWWAQRTRTRVARYGLALNN